MSPAPIPQYCPVTGRRAHTSSRSAQAARRAARSRGAGPLRIQKCGLCFGIHVVPAARNHRRMRRRQRADRFT